MKASEIRAMTETEIHSKLEKLDRVIDTHPQRSMRARAGGTKAVLLNELTRRIRNCG